MEKCRNDWRSYDARWYPYSGRDCTENECSTMGYWKGKSAMMICNGHTNLKYKFGNRNFWATGYYVSMVGWNTATIQKYISQQEKQDQIEDKLNTKEYEDPFKGSR